MSIYFKKQIYIYFFGIFVILSNSCETFDDLQFDNLALRGQIDSLSQRITVLSEEILEQKRITSNLTEQVSDNDEAISETSDLLEEAITDVNSLEDNLETISEYVGQILIYHLRSFEETNNK